MVALLMFCRMQALIPYRMFLLLSDGRLPVLSADFLWSLAWGSSVRLPLSTCKQHPKPFVQAATYVRRKFKRPRLGHDLACLPRCDVDERPPATLCEVVIHCLL